MEKKVCYYATVAKDALIQVKRFCGYVNADTAELTSISDAQRVLDSLIECFVSMHDLFTATKTDYSAYKIYLRDAWQATILII